MHDRPHVQQTDPQDRSHETQGVPASVYGTAPHRRGIYLRIRLAHFRLMRQNRTAKKAEHLIWNTNDNPIMKYFRFGITKSRSLFKEFRCRGQI